MPAWGNATPLPNEEILLVSSYVASLARPRDLPSKYQADKGKVIDPWPAAPEKPEEEVTDETTKQASRPADGEAIQR